MKRNEVSLITYILLNYKIQLNYTNISMLYVKASKYILQMLQNVRREAVIIKYANKMGVFHKMCLALNYIPHIYLFKNGFMHHSFLSLSLSFSLSLSLFLSLSFSLLHFALYMSL
jgi:hypothetical protein